MLDPVGELAIKDGFTWPEQALSAAPCLRRRLQSFEGRFG
jgi:hypothetical protein